MMIDRDTRKRLFKTVADRVIANADELTDLDRAIGDGDHGANMRRGFEAVLAALDELSSKSFGEGLKGVGTTLVMKVGGASGPLYGTLFLSLGKSLTDEVSREQVAEAFAAAIEAVKARGKSDVAQKTMLDVLFPVLGVLRGEAGGRENHSYEGDPRSRVVSRRAQHRSHGSRSPVVRADPRRGC
jgi:phosphoenolpyruvate---glycerone phosphotransferase subunit DhaL